MLARERHRNLLNVEPSLFIGRILSILLTHFFFHPGFNPLGLNPPNSYARRYFLDKIIRYELFHLHRLGNVFRQYMPSLLIGYYYYAWYTLLAPDMVLMMYWNY